MGLRVKHGDFFGKHWPPPPPPHAYAAACLSISPMPRAYHVISPTFSATSRAAWLAALAACAAPAQRPPIPDPMPADASGMRETHTYTLHPTPCTPREQGLQAHPKSPTRTQPHAAAPMRAALCSPANTDACRPRAPHVFRYTRQPPLRYTQHPQIPTPQTAHSTLSSLVSSPPPALGGLTGPSLPRAAARRGRAAGHWRGLRPPLPSCRI